MLAVERRKLILEKVHAEKKVIVSELSKEFEVSEETIKRIAREKLGLREPDDIVYANDLPN